MEKITKAKNVTTFLRYLLSLGTGGTLSNSRTLSLDLCSPLNDYFLPILLC